MMVVFSHSHRRTLVRRSFCCSRRSDEEPQRDRSTVTDLVVYCFESELHSMVDELEVEAFCVCFY